MFMVSVKLTGKKVLIAALVIVLAVSASMLWSVYRRSEVVETTKLDTKSASESSKKAESAEKSKEKDENKSKTKVKKIAGKTNEQRIEFIESFGWEINTEPAEVIEVIIPKEFDDVYKEYNSIQKMQGCDLSSHAGKRCKRYSYEILNYPGGAKDVRINLLVRDNKIIGGDVCTLEAGGFMHGFNPAS